jgi:hypothetical protein
MMAVLAHRTTWTLMPLDRGKEIFDDLVEFPPPRETGTRDYIFYFVDANDHGFGEAAHEFFKKHYKPAGYVEKDVHSLEELIAALFADVNAGITHIREIVIVCHATPQGMMPPVFASASATSLPEYRHITEKSLSFLQRDFKTKFSTFHSQRVAVVAKLASDSCVTIRACRVGSSLACMYACYAFFGGRANVYAPKEYMFFGHQFLLPGSRVENRDQLHQHLVKQHFVKNGQRTPDRKEALVRSILDPGLFTSPAQLAEKLSSSSTNDAADFNQLVKDLDAQRASDLLGAKFAAAGESWPSTPAIRVGVKGQRWRLTGTANSPGGTFGVDYFVDKQTVPNGVTLVSSARVRVTRGAEEFPFQLYMTQQDDDLYTGKVIGDGNRPFRLAAYAADTDPGKSAFDAIVTLLNGNHYSNGSIDLAAMFKTTLDVDLAQPPHIVSLTPNLSGPDARLNWSIGGPPSYLVKQEIAVASDASQMHTLTVYLDKEATAKQQEYQKSTAGMDPDTPGTELANYLDQYNLDDLADFIDYLHAPYRAENSFYIRHAQNAVNRKRDVVKWEQNRMGDLLTSSPVPRRPYTDLGLMESDDLKPIAYNFDFNAVWQEVKQSFPVAPPFQNDLFEEDPLWERISDGPFPDAASLPTIDSDTPFQDLETLRQMESQGLDPFFSESKEVYELPPPDQPDCDEFRTVVQKWKELQGQSSDAIREQLSELVTPEGKTFYSYLWEAFEWAHLIDTPFTLLEITEMGKGIPTLIVEHVGFLEESAVATVIAEDILPPLAGLLMWLGFAHTQVEAGEAWKHKGKIVAVRQWLLGLELLARHAPVPDEPHIDLGDDFHAAYASELGVDVSSANAFIPFPQEFKDGFEEGKESMERVAKKIVDRADEVSTKVLGSLNFSPCQIQILKDAGVFDVAAIRAADVEAIARLAREHIPRA